MVSHVYQNRRLSPSRKQLLNFDIFTIKGSSRRAEKSCKVLMMMMKAAKLGWVGPGAGQEQGMSKARVGQKREQDRSRAGAGQEQGRSRAEQSIAKQGRKRAGAGQELGRG